MATKIRLDRGGMAAMLKSSGVASAVLAAAHATESAVGAVVAHDGQVVPVEVTPAVTDRALARVTLMHAAGLGLQAKHGTLTKAAQAAGLEVKARK